MPKRTAQHLLHLRLGLAGVKISTRQIHLTSYTKAQFKNQSCTYGHKTKLLKIPFNIEVFLIIKSSLCFKKLWSKLGSSTCLWSLHQLLPQGSCPPWVPVPALAAFDEEQLHGTGAGVGVSGDSKWTNRENKVKSVCLLHLITLGSPNFPPICFFF